MSTYREADVRNAQYVWTMTAHAFANEADIAKRYYPGDE